MHFSAKRGIAIACRLSVRLSVRTLRTRQLEGVNPRKERKGCAQESDVRDLTARQLG